MECEAVLEAEKGQERIIPWSLWKECSLPNTLVSVPWNPLLDFYFQNDKRLNFVFLKAAPIKKAPHGLVQVCVPLPQSCPTLCDPIDCSPPGSSVHGSLKARVLEGIAMPFSRGSSQPRDQTCIFSCLLHWQMGSLPLGRTVALLQEMPNQRSEERYLIPPSSIHSPSTDGVASLCQTHCQVLGIQGE